MSYNIDLPSSLPTKPAAGSPPAAASPATPYDYSAYGQTTAGPSSNFYAQEQQYDYSQYYDQTSGYDYAASGYAGYGPVAGTSAGPMAGSYGVGATDEELLAQQSICE